VKQTVQDENVSSQVDRKSKLASLWPVYLGLGLVVGFFLSHQFWSTGFFTSAFGNIETILLYSALVSGLVPVVLGTLRLNRKIELEYLLLTATFWTGAAEWFFLVFPFDFSHLAAVVPGQLSFLLGWITNDIGRILLGVSLIGSAAFIPFYLLQLNGLSHRITHR